MAVKRIKLLPIEKVSAVYCALTSILMVVMMPWLVEPVGMLLMRVEWLALTVAVIALSHFMSRAQDAHISFLTFHCSFDAGRISTFLRVLAQMAWLPQWYPDTYEFNRSLQNQDHFFAAFEQSLFGCQPSIEFSQALPGALWSEAFNLGYFSYFPMIAILVITIFIKEWRNPSSLTPHSSFVIRHSSFVTPHSSAFISVSAIIQTAFFLYYLVYIFLPVTGPQFYFQAVGVDEILQGHFPSLGTYFSSHTEMLPAPGWTDGLFNHLVAMAHEAGERPTAAFPSSHIGISTIVMMLAYRHAPRLLYCLLPLWALLCCATVYIQAHYVVDAIAGLLSAPVALWVSTRLVRNL